MLDLCGFITDAENIPPIGIAPSPFVAAPENLTNSEAEYLRRQLFFDAFRTQHPDDAHFVCYHPTVSEDFPRLKKVLLPEMRKAGVDVVTTCFAFDLDNTEHRPWTEAELEAAMGKFQSVADAWPVAAHWSVFYSTRGGLRWVYILDEPVPVDQAERKIRWMVNQFRSRGLLVDALCDWTRLFRLPFVMREGKPTADNPLLRYYEQETTCLKSADIPGVDGHDDPTKAYAQLKPVEGAQPDDATAMLLIWEPVGGQGEVPDVGGKLTEYGKGAKKFLQGRECFDCIFRNAQMAPKGERDNTLHAYVGQAIGCLMGRVEGSTPDHVYGLFAPAARQLGVDDDWTVKLWDHVKRLWSKQEAKFAAVEQKKEEQAVEATERLGVLVEGFRSWCNHPVLHDTTNNSVGACEWVSRRAIACSGQCFHLIKPDGTYDQIQLSDRQLIPEIRVRGMEWMIETTKLTDAGEQDLSSTQIVNKHSFNISEVEYVCPNGSAGGTIQNLGLDDGSLILSIPAFRMRTDLVPEFNVKVDEWLRAMFGDMHYDTAMKWIAGALSFHFPIAALSLDSPGGTGKKMLVKGLAECLVHPYYAESMSLTDEHDTDMAKTPFVWINEGWPKKVGPMDSSMAFRILTGGDGWRINKKFRDIVKSKIPYRVIITANNDDVVERVIASKSLTPEDQQAIAERLIHMKIGDAGKNFLKVNGGLQLTGKVGARWIGGDGGAGSDYVVARHFLYLHKHLAPKLPTGRFIVEGTKDDAIMFKMRTRAGKAPIVVESIIEMLELVKLPEMMTIEEGHRLFVTNQQIVSHVRKNYPRENLSGHEVGNVLNSLVVRKQEWPIELPSKKDQGKKLWHEIDLDLILSVAQKNGFRTKALTRLMDMRTLKLSAKPV